MRILKYIAIVTFAMCTGTSFAQYTKKDFKKLKNLDGNWEAPIDQGFMQEKWVRVNDSTLQGEIYKIQRGVSILDEKAKITLTNTGAIIYSSEIHYLNKGVPLLFNLIKNEDGKLVFENKEKTSDQQVSYQMKGSDKMTRVVTRMVNGKEEKGTVAVTYAYYRK
jgi:hypothetical protein